MSPPLLSLWAEPRAILLWVHGVCGTGRGSRRVAFRARRRGGVKPVFPRLSGIRLAGRRVRGCDATPLPPRPRRDFRLLSSEAELGKARCRVWRGVSAPRLPRLALLWVGGLLVDLRAVEVSRVYAVPSPSILLGASWPYFASRLVDGAVTARESRSVVSCSS